MPSVSITQSFITRAKPKARTDYFDTNIPNLVLRVNPTKSGYSRTWLHREMVNKQLYVINLGKYPNVSIDDAQTKSRLTHDDIKNGVIEKKEVEAELAEFKGVVSKTVRHDKTFGSLLEAYADQLEADGAESFHKVKTHVRSAIRDRMPTIWNKLANKVSGEDIYSIIHHKALKDSPSSANLLLGYMKSAINRGMTADLADTIPSLKGFQIDVNFADKVPKRKTNKSTIDDDYALNEKQMIRFIEIADEILDKRWSTYAKIIMILGGQRFEQLRRLEKKHIKMDDPSDAWIMMDDKKADGRPHDLPMTPKLISLIKSLDPFQSGYLFEKEMRRREKGKPQYYEMGKIRESKEFTKHLFGPVSEKMIEEGSWDKKPFTMNIMRKTGEGYLAKYDVSREHRNWFLSHNLSGIDYKNYIKYDWKKQKLNCMKLLEKVL